MQKNILISFMLIARFACAMNNELQPTEDQQKYEAMILKDRVKNFRTWQELHKHTFVEKKIDDPEIIARYIDLTLFSDNAASKFKNFAFVQQAQQLAQKICPHYEYWSDYFRVKSVVESKIYEPEKMVQIILEPTMQRINRFKHKLNLLRGEYTEDFLQTIDWKKETELLEVHMNEKINNITLFSLIERAIAFRRPEYNSLSRSITQMRQSYFLERTLERKAKEFAQKKKEFEAELQSEKAKIEYLQDNLRGILREWAALNSTRNEYPWTLVFSNNESITKRDELFLRIVSLLE